MNQKACWLIGVALWLVATAGHAQSNAAPVRRVPLQPMVSVMTTNDLGLATNGPAVLRLFQITQSWSNQNPVLATNSSFMRQRQPSYTYTNAVFTGFSPDSLNHAIWTNFMASTNGRTMQVWSERVHPSDWPTNQPTVRWNTNNLMWGMKGLTALSPCWQGEGFTGQVPLTLLTRRHAYTRGHGMGPEGFYTHIAGAKAWFLTRDNRLVEAIVKRHVTRASPTNGVHRDYTILLFERDLPDSIESISAVPLTEIQTRYRTPVYVNWPYPLFQTQQAGFVNTGIAPFVVNAWNPGDSGSPNLIPLPGELVFVSGRSTSGPTPKMLADMDELCRLERLDPNKYQIQRPDLSKYPKY